MTVRLVSPPSSPACLRVMKTMLETNPLLSSTFDTVQMSPELAAHLGKCLDRDLANAHETLSILSKHKELSPEVKCSVDKFVAGCMRYEEGVSRMLNVATATRCGRLFVGIET